MNVSSKIMGKRNNNHEDLGFWQRIRFNLGLD
jgi:hypothetical protein